MKGVDAAPLLLVGPELHHLHIVGGEEVPEEVSGPVGGDKKVEILVAPQTVLYQVVELRENPLLRGP